MDPAIAGRPGRARRAVPAYASFGEATSPAERADAVIAAREAGFGAVKIRIDRADLAAGLATVRAAREAAGDQVEIMVDLNQGWRMPGDISPRLDAPAVAVLVTELPYDPPGWTPARRDFFPAEPVGIDANGCLNVPQRPGLGAEIDEDAVRHWASP